MIRAGSSDPVIASLLKNHPEVNGVLNTTFEGVEFKTNRHRFIAPSPLGGEVGGVVELMDNNPLVCGNQVWVPSAGGSLAVLALGPLLEAGLVIEPPAILLSFDDSEEEVAKGLGTVGYEGGFSFNCENSDLGTVRGAYCIAKITNPKSFDEIDDIYDERYGRSFFVRREESLAWEKGLVEGTPWACFRLELTEGESESLLAIHIMADINGKCGAGQYIHTMNIMCGFEESLGLV
jgi:hypothetical protein